MEQRNILAKIAAIAGTVLVWLPLLAPVIFAVISAGSGRGFRFDYLLPAELFPVTLVGGALLIAAALLARSRRWLVIASFGVAATLLAGGQGLATATGLASGEIGPGGWQFRLVSAMIAGSALAAAVLGAGGVLMIRDLFRSPAAAA